MVTEGFRVDILYLKFRAGHVQTMESQSIPRMVVAGQMFGKRPLGKPKKRCMDAVKKIFIKY
jgi:hypothetical protein